jgi:AbiV family abortive infection protein
MAPHEANRDSNIVPVDSQPHVQEWDPLVPPSRLERATKACHVNAESHLDSARVLLDAGKFSDAYHHSVMALEEVGKAELLTMDWMAQSREQSGYQNWMDDHLKKLFWSLWGPCFGREMITNDQIRTYQGLAKRIHEERLGGLYVDVSGEEPTIVLLSADKARSVIELAHTRLEMSKLHEAGDLALERREVLQWFMEAPSDPQKQEFIFSGTSQKKLVDLGDVWEWVKWLHDECVTAESAALEMSRRELNRRPPGENEKDTPKWRLRIRLHCPSHAVRKGELRKWNDNCDWIKLEAVDKRPHELIVDFTLAKSFPVQAFWSTGLAIVRWFLTALNIGTLGFFWFSKAEYTARFYDSILDLEADAEINVERSPKLELNWGNQALKGDLLTNVSTCLVGLPEPQKRSLHEPFDWYLKGIACLAKTDVHVPMVVDAFRGFYLAWKTSRIQYCEMEADADSPDALGAQIAEMFPNEEKDQENYVEFARGVENGSPDRNRITLNEVGYMKTLCDLALLQFLRKSAKEKLDFPEADQ